jgi:molybdate transport system substrate-binding protein
VRRILAAFALVLTTCTASRAEDGHPLSVFAAASLTASFQAIGKAFEAQHPHTKLTFNFAGSPTLVRQILSGAPADVFASADVGNMQRLSEERALAAEPQIFARNLLQIVVAKGNPKRIAGLADLARPGLIVVLCGETVPAGRYALDAFKKAGVTAPAGSRELDVKAVVSKVQLGEADAGIVYVTDVRAGGDEVEGVGLPEAQNVVAQYPIATIAASKSKEDAGAFIAFVRSPAGHKVLGDFGFLPP